MRSYHHQKMKFAPYLVSKLAPFHGYILHFKKKKKVQEKFKRELDFLIDVPKQQTGNRNDGNAARKFFRNGSRSAEVIVVHLELIKRLGIIIECINSNRKINLDKFEIYARETRDLCIEHYGWYPMHVTLHEVYFIAEPLWKRARAFWGKSQSSKLDLLA